MHIAYKYSVKTAFTSYTLRTFHPFRVLENEAVMYQPYEQL